MTTLEAGTTLVGMCRELKFREAVDLLYSPDIVSIEADGDARECRGIGAVKGKQAWFEETFETVGCEVEGPWINEPHFLVRFEIETARRSDGSRAKMSEYALYTVRDGKIVEERFF